MSELIIGSRNKERFAMYLALAAAVSLWLVPIDFANLNLTNINESGLLSFASSSILIAIVLYEIRIDLLLDKRIKKRAQTILWILKLSDDAQLKYKELTPDLDSAIEDPIVRQTLRDSKNGITTGCAILIGAVRYLSTASLLLPLMGLTIGLVIIYVSYTREELKQLPVRVNALAWFRIFQNMLNRTKISLDKNLKSETNLSSFEKLPGEKTVEEKIMAAKGRRESLNGLIERFQEVENIFQEGRWHLFLTSLVYLIESYATY